MHNRGGRQVGQPVHVFHSDSKRAEGKRDRGTAAHMKCEKAPLEDGPIALRMLCADPVHVPHAEEVQHARQDRVVWPWNIFEGSRPSVHAMGKPATCNHLMCKAAVRNRTVA